MAFRSSDNFVKHQVVHEKARIECWGCSRRFRTPSAMFIHLEAGTQCDAEIDRYDILDNILKCRGPWKNYGYDAFHYPFRCSCTATFPYVSSFLQHIESPSCYESYDDEWSDGSKMYVWGLLRQLRRNLGFPQKVLYNRYI